MKRLRDERELNERLIRTIEAYWSCRGQTVRADAVPLGRSSDGCRVWGVRSDMRNGLPRVAA